MLWGLGRQRSGTEVRGISSTTSVPRAWVGIPEWLHLGSWRGHARLHELYERFISRDEAADQEDEWLIASITRGVHDTRLLYDPLPWSQHDFRPRRNHLARGWCPEPTPPRFAFLADDGVGGG